MSKYGTFVKIFPSGVVKKLPYVVEPPKNFELQEGSVISYAHYDADIPTEKWDTFRDQPPQRLKYREGEAHITVGTLGSDLCFSVVIQSASVSDFIALRRHIFAKYAGETSTELTILTEAVDGMTVVGTTVRDFTTGVIVETINAVSGLMDATRRFLEPAVATP
jgi:hypothetical protein